MEECLHMRNRQGQVKATFYFDDGSLDTLRRERAYRIGRGDAPRSADLSDLINEAIRRTFRPRRRRTSKAAS